MFNIFIENCCIIIQICCLMFRLHTVAQEREKICKGLWTDTQRDTPPPNQHLTPTDNCFQQTNNKIHTKFYISKFRILVVGYHLTKLLYHLSRITKFTVFISPIKSVTRYESILFTFGLPMLVTDVLAWTFQFDLHFCSKIFANLTANWKTRDQPNSN